MLFFNQLKNKKLKKKYFIKIPNNVKILYCDKKNLITFIGPLSTKSLNLKIKLLLIPTNTIVVTNLHMNNKSKIGNRLQGTTAAKIKQNLIEITNILFYKLNFVGVGYRVFLYKKSINQIYFKLGYSHLIYFRIPIGLAVNCFKFTKLLLSSNYSYNLLTKISAQIRNCKSPEPYKGKGISYDKEPIILKKGKKI